MYRLFLTVAIIWMGLGANAQSPDDLQPFTLSYDALFLEAMMQRQKGNNDAAFDLLKRCTELNSEAAEAYYFLAQYYQLLKKDSLAQQYNEKALALEPDNATFLETMAHTNRTKAVKNYWKCSSNYTSRPAITKKL